jgi:hypothetical protein
MWVFGDSIRVNVSVLYITEERFARTASPFEDEYHMSTLLHLSALVQVNSRTDEN